MLGCFAPPGAPNTCIGSSIANGSSGVWATVLECELGCTQGQCICPMAGGAALGCCCSGSAQYCQGTSLASCDMSIGQGLNCGSGFYSYVWKVRERCSRSCGSSYDGGNPDGGCN